MKIVLMDINKLVNLNLPNEVFGNYWITNEKGENLISVNADNNGNWLLKSNSDVKIFHGDTPVNEVIMETYRFYTIRNVNERISYIIYTLPIYDQNSMQLNISLNKQESIYIGNNTGTGNSNYANVISYEQKGFAKNQLQITFENENYKITNLNPEIPLYVNGIKTEQSTLSYGDRIFILGLKFSIIRDIFYINNPNGLVKYDAKIFIERKIPQLDYTKIPTDPDPIIEIYKKEDYFLKPPRFDERIEEKQLLIDPPPQAQKQDDMPAILTMGSMMMMGMSSVMTGVITLTNVMNGTAKLKDSWPAILTTVAMIICMLIIPSLARMYNKHRKLVYERKRQATYSAYIQRKKEEFALEMQKEKQLLIEKYIPLKEVGDIILYKKRNLWEKNLEDYDFLSLRLGIGSIPTFFKVTYPDEHFSMDDIDNLMEYLRELERETKMLQDVPVVYSFIEKYVSSIIGTRSVIESFFKGLLLQMFAYHSYDELKIVVFTNQERKPFWNNIINTPYLWDDTKKIRFYGTNSDEINQISSYLEELVSTIKEINDSNKYNSDKKTTKLPKKFLIVADDIEAVRNVSIVREILESTTYFGISIIFLTDKLNSLPNEVENFISVDEKSGGVFERILTNTKRISFIPDFMFGSLEKYNDVVSNIPVALNGGRFILPDNYSFLEMYNVSNVNQLNANQKWQNNDPINTLSVPIGIDENGELFKLDLHEKFHGPHGLIAGMTGSGKSEFIITYILSLAVNYHPDEVQFVLIDYKGGGLAGAFENRETGLKLPHLAGTITNLDVNEINRSLASLQSELKRRQSEFNKARDKIGESTIDIYKYQRYYRNGQVDKPIAHLFIISDEFAELKMQQPEFMDELIQTARIGRSLGVHLILATQKPSGVVNDQIWSNTKFRICLKVQNRNDSQEMIKRPDAASIKETGRFYLQVGYDEYFALGQSAYTGAPYYESDKRKKKIDNDIAFVNNLGNPYKLVDDGKNNFTGILKGEELPNIMKYLSDIAKKENIHVKQLWLNALPPIIYIDGLKEKYEYTPESYNINPVIGEYDAPESQKQGLLTLPITNNGNWIIYGMADSGKDELINSFVYSCITTYSPLELNMYLIDFGAETLKMYRKAPQVGDVILNNENDKTINLFKMISSIIETRKSLFAEVGGSFETYIKTTNKRLPNIIIIINGFELFNETYGDNIFDMLISLTRDCQRYGVYFIMTSISSNGIRSRLAQYLPNHLVLQMNDKYDYSSLLARTKIEPANILGRGLAKLDQVYEFQTAVPVIKEELSEFAIDTVKRLLDKYSERAPKVPVLPDIVSIAYCSDEHKGIASIPLGVEKDSLRIRTLNIEKNLTHLITAMDFESVKNFGEMFIREISIDLNKNVYVFDTEKAYVNISDIVSYYDNNLLNNFKELCNNLLLMYEKYEKSGFDDNSLNEYKDIICVIVGIDKLKLLLGNEFNTLFANTFMKIKAMPKVHVVIIDNIDNIKKQEFEIWYKDIVPTTRGIWIGDGISSQFVLKSTVPARQLSTKINNSFGYYIDGSITVLMKVITEVGEDEYETL